MDGSEKRDGRTRQAEAMRLRMQLLGKNHPLRLAAAARRKYKTEDEARQAANARSREKYKKNPEYFRAIQRKWREANPERKREISAQYGERHRERLNAKQRERSRSPERQEFMRGYLRKHREANPDLYRTYTHNRRARSLAGGVHTSEEWLAKIDEFNGRCAYCASSEDLTRDHVVPLCRGGSNQISNIVPACNSCNSRKNRLTGEEYLARLATESA